MSSGNDETYEQLKQLADQFKLKAHLASMEAKTLWEEDVQPALARLEHKIDDATKDIEVSEDLQELDRKLRDLVEGVLGHAKKD